MDPSSPNTTERLLDVKRGLGHDLPPRPEPDELVAPPSPPTGVSCVSCGYSQHGAPFNRCPECGLLFASQILDPTPWSAEPRRLLNWVRTAIQVWSWDRRIRVRTAIVPITADSGSFANWSIALSAPLFGLAVAIFNWGPAPTVASGLGYALVEGVIGGVAAALLMLVARSSLKLSLRGRWRRDLMFVPASIDYATAWWPVLAGMCVPCGFAYLAAGQSVAVLLILVILSVIAVWAVWLWGSASESQNVPFTSLRVLALILCATAAGAWLEISLSGSSRLLMKKLATAATPSRPNIICAVMLDLTGSNSDEKLMLAHMTRMGVRRENLVLLRGGECTRQALELALAGARSKLGPQDRFFFYLNFRGLSDELGGIKLADGTLASYTLAHLLAATPTDHNLVVIESEQGDMLLPDLKTFCQGVVVTCPDVPEYRFNSGLRDFWETLGEPESDTSKDGRITVGEAFDAAFGAMRRSLAEYRRGRMLNNLPVSKGEPRFEVIGHVEAKDFWVPTPPAQSSTAAE